MANTSLKNIITIGTRGSALAMAQAHEVKNAILSKHTGATVNIRVIKTTGDKLKDANLSRIGGKGLFIKEIQEAMIANEVDLAVHSMKDMPAQEHPDLTTPCILERQDPSDAFISNDYKTIYDLPAEAIIGTSSVRRASQLLHARPDIQIRPFRGNISTRIEKLDKGLVQATFLATAGLKRLGLDNRISSTLRINDMIPAVAQGAIGVECRKNDEAIIELLQQLNHKGSFMRVQCERAFLKRLNGSCTTPLAALAIKRSDIIKLHALIALPDGSKIYRTLVEGSHNELDEIGIAAAEKLLKDSDLSIFHDEG